MSFISLSKSSKGGVLFIKSDMPSAGHKVCCLHRNRVIPIVFIRAGAIDQTNTNMMDIRWSFFRFWKPISQSEQPEIAPCGHCFARFILENSSNVYIAD